MVQIRLANIEDKEVIAGFQTKMALETENLKLDQKTVRLGVKSVFLDPVKGKYLVAEEENNIIASMLLTNEWSDWRDKWFLWMQSVYVVPEKREQGVFRKMYDFVKEMIKNDDDMAGLRLYVDSENKGAIATYKAIGMDGDHYKLFEWYK